jgi:hypothetical protein
LAASPLAKEEQRNSRSGNRLISPHIFTPNINAAGPGADKKKNTIDAANLPAEYQHLNFRETLCRKLFPRRSHNITDPRPRFLVHVTGNIGLPGRTVSLQFLKHHASQSCENCGSHKRQ